MDILIECPYLTGPMSLEFAVVIATSNLATVPLASSALFIEPGLSVYILSSWIMDRSPDLVSVVFAKSMGTFRLKQ